MKPPAWMPTLSIASIREVGPIAVLGIIALCLLGFAWLADEISENDIHAFDHAVMTWLHAPGEASKPLGPDWLLNSMIDITALGGYTILILLTLGAALYRIARKDYVTAGVVVAAIGSGALVTNLLKLGFDRARPDFVEHLTHAASSSFPSGHATQAAIAFLTLGALMARTQENRRVKALILGGALFLTILVGISRLYLGVHWPTDVLAGWCLGAAWAGLWWLLLRRIAGN
ncbi:PAP2 domain protein [Hyphomonas neptunium ATCC 15444]|uniref:PAP2 domain protein n=2 Tax=Hyphomonas TaxID=85 RepID=Q0C4P6_HYPNA|nr:MULTISPECIES: phosphatase PAP2 family protein [Hyphomonas]ABI75362.1 PAP2 domain protein [Hyphomonas neptunium ATCC 15444]KCZ96490.1 PAP2 (2 phosphatidic acid phosphatase) family protein [Hyphomonas hirschiana VP5]